MSNEENKNSNINEVLEWVKVIFVAILVSILIRSLFFETVAVDQKSMQHTLEPGQRLILYKFGYHFSQPKRGDIIVFEHQEGIIKGFWKHVAPFPIPQEVDFIKRIIALPGDSLDIKEGAVYLNGLKLEEPYVQGITNSKGMKLPAIVPENKIFAMGDNREVSSDSRQLGFIDLEKIKGKAVLRLYPFDTLGGIY